MAILASIVLITDVFGLNAGLLALGAKLGAKTIINPYAGEHMGFASEADAYAYFIESLGHDGYLQHVQSVIGSMLRQAPKQPVVLVGFSVGATVIWRLSGELANNVAGQGLLEHGQIQHGLCFYGSQIRNFTQINPRFGIDIILPKHEPHFDVQALQATLSSKANVSITHTDYLHGFMNAHSDNYHPVAEKEYIDRLRTKSKA